MPMRRTAPVSCALLRRSRPSRVLQSARHEAAARLVAAAWRRKGGRFWLSVSLSRRSESATKWPPSRRLGSATDARARLDMPLELQLPGAPCSIPVIDERRPNATTARGDAVCAGRAGRISYVHRRAQGDGTMSSDEESVPIASVTPRADCANGARHTRPGRRLGLRERTGICAEDAPHRSPKNRTKKRCAKRPGPSRYKQSRSTTEWHLTRL